MKNLLVALCFMQNISLVCLGQNSNELKKDSCFYQLDKKTGMVCQTKKCYNDFAFEYNRCQEYSQLCDSVIRRQTVESNLLKNKMDLYQSAFEKQKEIIGKMENGLELSLQTNEELMTNNAQLNQKIQRRNKTIGGLSLAVIVSLFLNLILVK